MLEIKIGSEWCNNCGEYFNASVLLDAGEKVISLCAPCAMVVTCEIMDKVVEIKSRGLEGKNNG